VENENRGAAVDVAAGAVPPKEKGGLAAVAVEKLKGVAAVEKGVAAACVWPKPKPCVWPMGAAGAVPPKENEGVVAEVATCC